MSHVKKGGRRSARANNENIVKVAVPEENDILCGKDRSCALHKGSQKFRLVIDSYRGTYLKATTKYDKMQITKEIYEIFLAQNVRFLKYNDKEKLWEEIAPLAARDKVGHALRFANQAGAHGKNNLKSSQSTKKSSHHKKVVNIVVPHEVESFGNHNSNNPMSSARSLPGTTTTNAELVAELVEVAKEEPQVWDNVVDHLNNVQEEQQQQQQQQQYGNTNGYYNNNYHNNSNNNNNYEMNSMPNLGPPQGFNDPCALENIAYAVDTGTEDALLDGLVNLLNNDTETEEYFQDVVNQAAYTNGNPVDVPLPSTTTTTAPTSIDISFLQQMTIPEDQPVASLEQPLSTTACRRHIRRTSSLPNLMNVGGKHHREFSDGMWSVMQEPLMDLDWR